MRSPALRLRASFAKLRSERFCWPLSNRGEEHDIAIDYGLRCCLGVLPNVAHYRRAPFLRASG